MGQTCEMKQITEITRFMLTITKYLYKHNLITVQGVHGQPCEVNED